jgi:hypothetical protein
MACGGQKEQGVTKDHKGLLITENCKKVHNGDAYSVLGEKPHESVYFNGTYVCFKAYAQEKPHKYGIKVSGISVIMCVTWNCMLAHNPQNLISVLSIWWTDTENL